MSATRASPVSFPGEATIKKQTIEKLLSKRSYVDSTAKVLVLPHEGNTSISVAHVPEKYAQILHIISYRYKFRLKSQSCQVFTVTPLFNGIQV